MKVQTFNVGDTVKMVPETKWRGVIVSKHEHRANGYKVRTTVPYSRFTPIEFWVRPISLQLAEPRQVTYWLWHGERCLTSVRGPEGMSDNAVINRVLLDDTHINIAVDRPYETPLEFRNKVLHATVKTYEDGA